MYYYDPYIPLIFIALAFSFWAQWKVNSTYKKFSKIKSASGLTGAEVARKILDSNGLKNVPVKTIEGKLADNYDPTKKVLNLSSEVYASSSLSSYGIAAHEAGHAIQHSKLYLPIKVRNFVFPIASLGSNLAIPLFFLGFLFSLPMFMTLGILFFSFAVLFSIITLPVEYNASARAVAILNKDKFLNERELRGAKSVLDAAALTYLAATLMALLQLLRLIFLRNSRD